MAAFMRRLRERDLRAMRIVTGFLFLWHGAQKLFGFPPLPEGMEIPAFIVYVAGPIELIGGVLVMIGLLHPLGGVPVQRPDGGGLLDGARHASALLPDR